MPVNKYASESVNQAYLRALDAWQAYSPPAFNMFPQSDDYEDCREQMEKKLLPALNEFFHAVMVDANYHSPAHIGTKNLAPLDEGLSGFFYELSETSESLREDELEAAR